ncbi:hypothetical protein [Bradyrhizobium cosmicum]|uniref:hypothetical protein n=1 Tax=Bradyrhizobium cosmicum TaxID=1404864 RepID=UPI0028E33999|nr:hypothetical protein [Bradyrhizobium cosmicum]
MYILGVRFRGWEGAAHPAHAPRLNNDADANPPQGLANRKTRKPYCTAMPRKDHFLATMQLGSRLRQRAKASPDNFSWPSVSRRVERAKLLRGQGFPDMSDSDRKVANYYGKSRL